MAIKPIHSQNINYQNAFIVPSVFKERILIKNIK